MVNPKQTGVNGIELYTEWYLKELMDNGYIKQFFREPFSIEVFSKAPYQKYDFKKTKYNIEEFNIFSHDNYTPDYMIIWSQKAKDIFYSMLDGTPIFSKTPFYAYQNADGNIVSLIDVKPPSKAGQFAGISFSTFPIKQKALWFMQGIYVNKTVPIPMSGSGNTVALFSTTFCPRRFVFTDGGQQPRKIGYPTMDLKRYVALKEKELSENKAVFAKQNAPKLM